MAKPRVFVSSTYYDLRHIRDRMESFIEGMGFEAVLFESGDIPFRHDIANDLSCYEEISLCHILVLIIGSRYGSAASADEPTPASIDERYKFYNSITSEEYRAARKKDIPIFIFVERNILAEYSTFKRNRKRDIDFAHVDSANVFVLLDEIMAQSRNNFVRGFDRFDDIASWLRSQWAGLFADFLAKKSAGATLTDMAAKIAELGEVSSALKEYAVYLVRNAGKSPGESDRLIGEQERKIEDSRLTRFSAEPLIDYLTKAAMRFKLRSSTPSAFLKEFARSKTLEDFLERLGFDPQFRKDFLEKHSNHALNDYETLQARYNHENAREAVATGNERPFTSASPKHRSHHRKHVADDGKATPGHSATKTRRGRTKRAK